MASGPNLEVVTDIVVNLATSDLDHALNGMEFGDFGELFFTSGSNTNGGVPGPLSQSGMLKENFLSGAVNVAYISHPDFDGNIRWSAPDDGNMIAKGIDIFASGLRNPFSIVMHSNGRLFGTDNGPNVGYGRMMTGCGLADSIEDQQRNDELVLIENGRYYGHPNLKRAKFFNDTRQCAWIGPEVKSTTSYTAPLLTHASSIDGLMEFHGNHFDGQLRHNLLFIRYSASNNIFRVILNANGTGVVSSSTKAIPLNIGLKGLDITQAPNGNIIEIRYPTNSVFHYKPVEPETTDMVIKSTFPRRGPNSGGNMLSIYGVNLNRLGPSPTVSVGNKSCQLVSASSNRIDCRLPGGTGTVDITVSNGPATSTFSRGYRYISGVPAIGFKLPIYS
jgi:Glucose / Sorbosone dehydrogenase/IPT/TIG domain